MLIANFVVWTMKFTIFRIYMIKDLPEELKKVAHVGIVILIITSTTHSKEIFDKHFPFDTWGVHFLNMPIIVQIDFTYNVLHNRTNNWLVQSHAGKDRGQEPRYQIGV
ncbi:hypothetical protein ACJX0J_029812, partial [Zea mays]